MLLCPPDYFSYQPINEITRGVLARGEQPDLEAFRQEHAELLQAYRDNGVEVVLIEPDPELPYMVYARDFGACVAEGVLIGSFKEPIRQGEDLLYEAKIRELGIPVVGRVSRGSLEGGDFWFLDEATVVHGVVARTDWEGLRNAQEILEPLGYTVTGVQLASKNLHLDMAFNIVAPGDKEMLHHPYLGVEACEQLVALGCGLVGTDAFNVDSSARGHDACPRDLAGQRRAHRREPDQPVAAQSGADGAVRLCPAQAGRGRRLSHQGLRLDCVETRRSRDAPDLVPSRPRPSPCAAPLPTRQFAESQGG